MYELKNILTAGLALCFISTSVFAAEKNDSEVKSGVYENHQLIPNQMATLCKTSAEEMVKNPETLTKCINQLALKRRSSDAETSREGLKDLNDIKAEQLSYMLSSSIAKGAAVAGYYVKGSEQVADANKEAKTENDVDAAAINTNAVLTSVVNSLRDLYVEQLKYLAISNIENIEKDTLMEVASLGDIEAAQKKENEQKKDADKGNNDNQNTSKESEGKQEGTTVETSGVTATTTEEIVSTEWQIVNGVCKLCAKKGNGEYECREDVCKDGEYPDANNKNVFYTCKSGTCERIDMTDISNVSSSTTPSNSSEQKSFLKRGNSQNEQNQKTNSSGQKSFLKRGA